jgi:tRNA modification GTPase
VAVSALTGAGVDDLLKTLAREIERRFGAQADAPALTRARHRAALEDCAAHLDRALSAPQIDQRAEDVRLALRSLGRITGRVDVEDLLDIIFSDFCIGK